MDASDNLLSATSEDNEVVSDWVQGLPTAEELTPLSQPLITPQLASGFSVTPEPNKTILDVHRSSQDTISTLRCHHIGSSSSSSAIEKFSTLTVPAAVGEDETLEVVDEEEEELGIDEDNTVGTMDEGEIGGLLSTDDAVADGKGSSKRTRLVWTAQLHKRFVDVVKHLGIKNAVPKTIMQLMNVEGLTRENVASHLQKYRLYVKRINGVSNDDTVPSDSSFTGIPLPHNTRETPVPAVPMPVPLTYVMPPQVIPMPVYGLPHKGNGESVSMISRSGQLGDGSYSGFAAQHPYAVFRPRPGGWPGGKQPNLSASTPHDATKSDK